MTVVRMLQLEFPFQIQAPCYFFLGAADQRVDKGQGLKLYKHLLARGVDAKCNMYDDNHSLSKIENGSDVLVTAVKWFDAYTRK